MARPVSEHEGTKRRSTFDLKDQLSDLQNKLAQNQQGKGVKKRISASNLDAPETQAAEDALGTQKIPGMFGRKNKDKNSRNSLPPMALGAGAGQQGKPGSDVNFVVGLSENLLLECRRLTAENSQYKQQLKDSQDEVERVTKQLANVTVINKKFVEEGDKIKDKNWELESSLQAMKEKLDKLHGDHTRSVQSRSESESVNDQLKTEVEVQKSHGLRLASELASVKQAWATETKHYKGVNDELNYENDRLHKSVSDLKEEVQALKNSAKRLTATLPPLNDTNFFSRDDSNSDEEFSVLDDPDASPIKDGPARNIELEKDTIQSNLIHSNKTIAKLRSTISKLRSERHDLEKQIAASGVSGDYGSPVNKNRKAKALRQPASKRNSKAFSVAESDDITREDWDDLSFSNAPVQPIFESQASSDEEHGSSRGQLLSQELEHDPMQVATRYASENGLVLVNAQDYQRLKEFDDENLAHPVEFLKSRCSAQNLVAVDRDEYDELVAKALHEPTEAELLQRVSALDRVTLPVDEYKKLVNTVEHPSLEYLKTKLFEDHSFVSIPEDEALALKNPSLDQLRQYGAVNDHTFVPSTEHESLVQKALNPTLEQVRAHGESHDHVVIPREKYQQLETPPASRLYQLATASGLVLLNKDEHTKLVEQVNSPSLQLLTTKAESLGHTIIPKEQLQAIQRDADESVHERAKKIDHVVIPREEHSAMQHERDHLQSAYASPSLDYLKDKVASHGHVVVESSAYEGLVKSDATPLSERAKASNQVLVEESEYANLLNLSQTPPLDFITTKADSLGYAVIPQDTHKKLVEAKAIVDDTKYDFIASKAEAIGCKLVAAEDFALLEKVQKPDGFTEVAASRGLTAVPNEEHDALQKAHDMINNITKADLGQLASPLGLSVIENSQIQELERKVANPTLEELKAHEESMNIVIIDANEHEALHEMAHNPTLDLLGAKAQGHGHVLVDSSSYEDLKSKALSPTLDEVKSHSATHGHSLVSNDDLNLLKKQAESPTVEHLKEKAAVVGMEILPSEELVALKRAAEEPLNDRAAKAGATVVPDDEYANLKNAVENPSVKYLKDASERAGYELIPHEEAKDITAKIESPTPEYIEKKAAFLGLVALPLAEHERLLKSSTSPELDEIVQFANKRGQTVLPTADYDALVHPSHETVSSNAQALGYSLVASEELESMRDTLQSPSLSHVQAKASSLEHAVLPIAELENLKEAVSSPGLDHLHEKAALHEHKLIPESEYSSLKESAAEPLVARAAREGAVVLPLEEHETLTKAANATLHERAQAENSVVLPVDDHASLVQERETLMEKIKNPSESFLETSSRNLGFDLIPEYEYKQLLALKDEPLDERAAKEGQVVLPSTRYDELLSTFNSPTVDFLKQAAESLSYVVIPTDEMEELQRKAQSPTQDELQSHAESRGFVVLDKESHDEWKSKALSPDLDFLKDAASAHNHSVVDKTVYENALKDAAEPLSARAAKTQSVIVPETDFRRLSTLQETPGLDFLREKAAVHDHVLLPNSQVEDLKAAAAEPLASRANKEGVILFSPEEYAKSESDRQELERELASYKEKSKSLDAAELSAAALALGLVVLKEDDYKKLSIAAASPTVEQLSAHALKRDHVLLPKWKHEILDRRANSPSEDEVRTCAKSMGFELVETSELTRITQELETPSREVLKKAAAAQGLSLVPVKEYNLLKDKFESTSAVPSPIDTSAREVFPSPNSPSLPASPASPNTGKSKVLSSKERFEEIIRQENEKKQVQKAAASKALGLVTLSTDEYKRLVAQQQVNEPTISDIYNGAKVFGLTVLPQSDYKALLKRQAPVETQQDLESVAKALGFTVVPISATFAERRISEASLSSHPSTASLTDDDEFHDAVSHMTSKVSLVSTDDYTDALSRAASIRGPMSVDVLEERAAELGFKLSPLDGYETEDDTTSIEDNDVDNEDTVRDQSLAHDAEALRASVEEKDAKIVELENRKVLEYEVVQLAQEHGLVVISQDVYDDLKHDLTDDELKASLSSRGYVVLPGEEYEEFNNQLASYAEAKEHDSRTFDQERIAALAAGSGLVALSASDFASLKAHETVDLDAAAAQKNLKLVPADDYSRLQAAEQRIAAGPSPEEVELYIQNKGHVSLPKEEHEALVSQASKNDEPPSAGTLRDLAISMGYVMISSEDHDDLQQKSRSVKTENVENGISVDALESRAHELDMSLVSTRELEALRNRDISANDLAIKAAKLDLVLISQQAYEDLKSTSVSGSDMIEAAKKLGFLCIPEAAYIPTTVAPTADVHNVVVLPKTYYNKLARSHSLSIERISKDELVEHCKKRGILLASDVDATGVDVPERYDGHVRSHHSPQSSFHSPLVNSFKANSPVQDLSSPTSQMRASPSAFSIATNASLTDRKMIPALTQTIIGEYLFKYYRRLGAFSSISENRHERYFWIHPYSLTLYWSATNPVISDPSTNKIRAAAILKVEQVEDNNPLPPGLYHKSIVVHSSERTFKFTCPTRQRHNVWYNSLRYLLERSTDGLEFSSADVVDPHSAGHTGNAAKKLAPTIEEAGEDGSEDTDIDTYRYIRPRASLIKAQRSVSNPSRKSSRIFSPVGSNLHRSSTSASLHRK